MSTPESNTSDRSGPARPPNDLSGANRLAEIEAVFLAVIEAEPSAREHVLAELCAGRDGVQREVESLLANHESRESVFDTANSPGRQFLTGIGMAPLPDHEPTLPPDRRIGPYAVLGILGCGGMGVVYVAEQDRPRRTVALKVLRQGIDSESLLRRFEYEGEILGRLRHPGIAQVYEAGTARTPHGTYPFIAMELVKGRPLHEHTRSAGLTTRETLALVAKVADAIGHAHLCGVIHRDLKPANIIVEPAVIETATSTATRIDDRIGTPKILDFGVARISGQHEQLATMQTGQGQLIGTLPYMSPEQVAGNAQDVDARADVYALGVILYELLTGRLPHDPLGKSMPELARMIRDDEPTRLSTLGREFRGDIDVIVTKALAKDRERRYQSAADLAADLRRCIEGLPIFSRHDSAMYVLRKHLRRHFWAVTAAAVFVLAIAAAGIIATVQWQRASAEATEAQIARNKAQAGFEAATRERIAADEARDRADKAANETAAALSISNIERGRLHGAAGALRPAEDLIWPEFLRAPLDPHARWSLWEVYSRNPCRAAFADLRGVVERIAFNNSGTLAAAADTHQVVLYDVAKDERVIVIEPPGGLAGLVAFVCDDTLLVGAAGGAVLTYRPPWDHPIETRIAHPTIAKLASTASTVGCVATAAESGPILLWSDGSPEPRVLPSPEGQTASLSIAPDGQRVLIGQRNGRILLVRCDTGEVLQSMVLPVGRINDLALSPDGRSFVVSSPDRIARVYNPDWALTAEITADSSPIPRVAWKPDGKSFVTIGWFSVTEWTPDGQKVTQTFAGHRGSAACAAYSPDGQTLMTGDSTGALRLWETTPMKCLRAVREHVGRTLDAVFSPDGTRAASCGAGGQVFVLDPRSGAVIRRLEGLAAEVNAVVFSPGGQLVAAGDNSGALVVWDTLTGEVVHRAHGLSPINAMKFLRDGSGLVTAHRDRFVRQLDLDGNVLRQFGRVGEQPGYLSLSPDGKYIVTSPARNGVQLFDFRTGEDLGVVGIGEQSWVAVFSPDSRRIAVGAWSGNVQMLDIETRTITATLSGHDRLISSVAFSPDGQLIAASCFDGTIKIFDAAEHRCLLTLPGHPTGTRSVSFSPDGLMIISTGDDGMVGLWDLTYYDRHIKGNLASRRAR